MNSNEKLNEKLIDERFELLMLNIRNFINTLDEFKNVADLYDTFFEIAASARSFLVNYTEINNLQSWRNIENPYLCRMAKGLESLDAVFERQHREQLSLFRQSVMTNSTN